MTKEELLLDTLEYYSVDPANRRCRTSVGCRYSPKSLGLKESEGCAIGRHLSPEVALDFDNRDSKNHLGDISSVTEEQIKMLPEWMQSMDKTYLSKIQQLHDCSIHWDLSKDSLTYDGQAFIKEIIFNYKLNSDKFSKYLD